MLAGLMKRLYASTRSRDISDVAAKASYLIANVQASKPFPDGELVKICIKKVVEVVCCEQLS